MTEIMDGAMLGSLAKLVKTALQNKQFLKNEFEQNVLVREAIHSVCEQIYSRVKTGTNQDILIIKDSSSGDTWKDDVETGLEDLGFQSIEITKKTVNEYIVVLSTTGLVSGVKKTIAAS